MHTVYSFFCVCSKLVIHNFDKKNWYWYIDECTCTLIVYNKHCNYMSQSSVFCDCICFGLFSCFNTVY